MISRLLGNGWTTMDRPASPLPLVGITPVIRVTQPQVLLPSQAQTPPPTQNEDIQPPTHKRKRKKWKEIKVCGVCKEIAKSLHFGGMSCDSCKAFFRRSVIGDRYKTFQCIHHGDCVVDVRTRRYSCQYCRYKKCIENDMNPSWVMNDEERAELKRQRIEKDKNKEKSKEQTTNWLSPPINLELDKISELNSNVRRHVTFLVNTYQETVAEIPFTVVDTQRSRDNVEVVQMLTTLAARLSAFIAKTSDFLQLQADERLTMLNETMVELCALRAAESYDESNKRWPKPVPYLEGCPALKAEDFRRLVGEQMFKMHMNFIGKIQKLQIDEEIGILLVMIVYFTAGDKCNVPRATLALNKYLHLLTQYVRWKFKNEDTARKLGNILIKLVNLRELSDAQRATTFQFSGNEAKTVKERFIDDDDKRDPPLAQFNRLEGDIHKGANIEGEDMEMLLTSRETVIHCTGNGDRCMNILEHDVPFSFMYLAKMTYDRNEKTETFVSQCPKETAQAYKQVYSKISI